MTPLILRAFAVFVVVAISTVCLPTAKAQEVVVSEYVNQIDETLEWTELLVLRDNLNMVGWIVTDDNGTQTARQGGCRFKDIPLWRNVRAGTIIVIHHRGQSAILREDLDPSDGYIETTIDNAAVLDVFKFATGAFRNEMSVATDGDFLQIYRADTTYVHGLGHRADPGPSYLSAQRPKANYPSSLGNANSVAVTGSTLAAYDSDVNRDSLSILPNNERPRPGFPNILEVSQRANRNSLNHLFWRSYREPTWPSSPTIQLRSQTATNQTIEWTAVTDPFPADNVTGYLVLRSENNFVGFDASLIRDGATFTAGQTLSGARILAMQPTSAGAMYVDNSVECGKTYWYRVFAYRFAPDQQLDLASTPDSSARGRQWQTSQVANSPAINRPLPPKPVIRASATSICPGDLVTLSVDTDAIFYEWTVNGVPVTVTGTKQIIVTQAGTYRLRVRADGGCEVTSDPITITERPAQVLDIAPSGVQTICSGDSIVIRVLTAAPVYEWRRNGQPIPGETGPSLTVRQAGDYQVRAVAGSGCPAISPVLTVRIPDVRVRFEPATLDFGILGACATSLEGNVDLVNDGTVPVTIGSSTFPSAFSVLSPAPGTVTLQPGQRTTVRLRFSPSVVGLTTGTGTIAIQPCAGSASLSVRGSRNQVLASVDVTSVDYGDFIDCDTNAINVPRRFVIRNSGTESMTLRIPVVSAPFFLERAPASVLPAGSTDTVIVRYIATGIYRNRGVIEPIAFPFTAGACSDTLRASLQASTFKPSLEVVPPTLDLGTIAGCDSVVTASVILRNNGVIPITVTAVSNPNVTVPGLPVTIQPSSELPLNIRVVPGTLTGSFTQTLDLRFGPCENTGRSIVISGILEGASATLTGTGVIGPITTCGLPVTDSTELVLTVGNGTTPGVSVSDVAITGPFAVDLVPGDGIVGSRSIRVRATVSSDGIVSGSITVQLQPCSIVVSLPLQVIGRAVSASLSRTNLDFGTIAASTSAGDLSVVVRNTGTDTINVSGTFPAAPFIIRNVEPSLPARLAPGDTLLATYGYTQSLEAADDSTTVTLTYGKPPDCLTTTIVTLRGRTARPGDITGVVVAIPRTLRTIAGSDVRIPVSLTSPTDLRTANALELQFEVAYDPTLLRIVGFDPGVYAIAVDEVRPGRAVVRVSSPTPIEATPVLATLVGRTYYGERLTAELAVDSVRAQRIVATGEDGLITMTGDCEIESRGVGIASPLLRGSYSTDRVVIDVGIPSHDRTDLKVYATDGSMVAWPLSGRMEPGQYRVSVPIPAVASSVVFVEYSHGAIRKSCAIAIVR